MKKLVLSLAVLLSLTACLKTKDVPPSERVLVAINFSSVFTPETAKTTDTITALIRVSAPDLCYKFEGIDSRTSGNNQFDLQAVGSKPNPQITPLPTCDPFPYTKDTTFKFRLQNPGKYVLRYYNGTTLLQADTLNVVN